MISLKSLLPEDHWEDNDLKSVLKIPSQLYHATFTELVNSIIKGGLVPSKIGPNFTDTDVRFVYLGTNPSKCKELMKDLYDNSPLISKRLSGKINVLTLTTKGLDKKKFFHDPKSELLHMEAFMYMDRIPAKNIIDYGDISDEDEEEFG